MDTRTIKNAHYLSLVLKTGIISTSGLSRVSAGLGFG
jgi:hypothetical protein